MSLTYDFAVVGGGIVGLSTALALSERFPQARGLVLEKEASWAAHQTGHNSGVIHAGLYYKPGSLKARHATAGNASMVAFCQTHDIPHEICGKVIVATEPEELPLLENLRQRAAANGVETRPLTPEGIHELEPHVQGLAGLHVPSTGIVDYKQVAQTYVRLLHERTTELRLHTRVTGFKERSSCLIVETDQGSFEAKYVVNCAGLHSDRVAKLSGVDTGMKIVPFRGEYYELVPERRDLVKSLIYPVPNPSFPFLGVHFTRMIDGTVHAGPNAVLSLKREGYHKSDVNLRDFAEVMAYPAFWRLARQNMGEGWKEIVRSFSKRAFVRSLQRLIPEVQEADVVPTHAGVRAQALKADGALMDDFHLVPGPRSLHVCNAPSPGATASLEIGNAIASRVAESLQPAGVV